MGRSIGIDDALRAGIEITTKPRRPIKRNKDVGIDDALVAGQEIRITPRTKPAAPSGGAPRTDLSKRTPFPLAVLPPAVAEFCQAVADSVQVPPDVPAFGALIVAGAAIGGTRTFEFRHDWYATPTLFGAVIGASGTGKSPAIRQVLAPLRAAQKKNFADAKRNRETYEELRRNAKGGSEPLPSKPPRAARYTVDDITMEGLVKRHHENPRGFLCHRDELAGWIRSMDAYRGGKGGDRQRWLQIWDGDPISVDRKTDDEELYLDSSSVSLLGSIQPSMLGTLADKDMREDGLLPRFVFCYPGAIRDNNPYSDKPVPKPLAAKWRHTIDQLLALNFSEESATVVLPSPGVVTEYESWYNASCREMDHADFPSHLRPVWSKLRVTVLRLALILHQLRLAGDDGVEDATVLDAESMRRAVLVAEWAKRQAAAVFSSLHQDAVSRQLQALVAWVRRKVDPDEHGIRSASVRDIQRSNITGLTSASDTRKLCLAAADRGLAEFNNSVLKMAPEADSE